jgi:hypothetical protein
LISPLSYIVSSGAASRLPRIVILGPLDKILSNFCDLFFTTKIVTLEIAIFGLKMIVKSGLEFFILKFNEPLQGCCRSGQKNLLRRAELAWLVSRYIKGLVKFKNKENNSTTFHHN